jgi:hypothetical protein
MPMNPRLLRPLATGFDPRRIAGLELWLNPADTATLTLNGSTVSQINDASGNGRHFVQSTGGSQPGQTSVNGRNALTFNAQWMRQTALSAYANRTTVIVYRRDGTNSQAFAGIFGYRNANSNVSGVSNSDVFFELRAENNVNGTPTSIDSGGLQTASAWANGAAATLVPGTFAGVPSQVFTPCPVNTQGQLALVAINTTQTANGNKMPILANEGFNAARTYRMTLCELLVYSNELTTAQRQRVERYLAAKWGITL